MPVVPPRRPAPCLAPVACALAASLGIACAGAPPPAADGPAEPAPVAAPPATTPPPAAPDPSKLDESTARAEAERILAEVARARALEVNGETTTTIISAQGIRDFVKDGMYDHVTPDQLQLFGRIEQSLGVLPAGSDPEQVLLDLLEEGVLGLYDPKRKTLFIRDDVSKSMLTMVAGHEIAHGLQDMHFDLEKLQLPIEHQTDRETARTFLVEGDAQAAYWSWVGGEQGLGAMADPVLDAMGNQALDLADMLPYPILVRQMQLPYADGAATVTRLVRQKGWDAVDALYADLPETSEQMLHVDKLLAREPAIPVEVDAGPVLAALPAHTQVWHDTLGEADLLAMLAQTSASPAARDAAAGWGGSHLLALDHQTRPATFPVVVAALAWDSERDAREFESAFTQYLQVQVGDRSTLRRRKDVTVFATGVPGDADPEAVVDGALRGLKVRRGGKRR